MDGQRNDNNTKVIHLLVSKGADVNLASNFLRHGNMTRGITFHCSALYRTAEEGEVDLTKFLLENGAQKFWALTKASEQLLKVSTKAAGNFAKVKEVLQQGALVEQEFSERGEATLAKAKRVIEDQKFTFFLGKWDSQSVLLTLPQALFVRIFTCGQRSNGNIEKVRRARERIDAIIREICQPTLLFLLGRNDENSFVHMLPQELVTIILSQRIIID
jgi:hypothetical protein